jgi:hypothetical protein
MRHTGEAQIGNGDLGEVDHGKDASTAVQSAGGMAEEGMHPSGSK